MTLPEAIILCAVCGLACLTWLVVRLTASGDASNVSLEWLEELSADKYLLMNRLLYEGDYAFLSRQPGYCPAIAKRLRAERKRLFRNYVRQLNHDFNRLMSLANIIVVGGGDDQSELAASLLRMRCGFYLGIVSLECRLALAPLGVQVSGVNTLVKALSEFRSQVIGLVPAGLLSEPAGV